MLTRKEAQQRNWNISQIRGVAPRLASIIPDDLQFEYTEDLRHILELLMERLNEVKVKKYTCSRCTDTTTLTETRNRQAVVCDVCNNWGVGKLYLLPKRLRQS